MPLQRRNPELVSLLSADLQPRYEPNFAWGQASGILLASQLRGHWPMSSVVSSGNVVDISGQNRTLTNNNAATFGVQGICPYAEFNGTTQYLSRTDEADLDITGSLTCGCWAYFENTASAVEEIICKTGGPPQRAWSLQRRDTGVARFNICDDCTNETSKDSSSTMAAQTWYFVWGRFVSGISIDVGINRDYWSQATAIAALCNSNADFTIAASAVPNLYMEGRIALPFLCADDLSDAQVWNIFEQTRALFGV